jgi:hypothetical protein|eukprot:COSAG02_NODE_1852_length_10661_cov_3.072429_13_plen_147_part_00
MSTAPSRGIGTITHPKLRKPGPRAELVGFKQRHALEETSVFKLTFRADTTVAPAANEIGGASDIALWGASSCGDLAKVRRAIQGGVNPSAQDPTVRVHASLNVAVLPVNTTRLLTCYVHRGGRLHTWLPSVISSQLWPSSLRLTPT